MNTNDATINSENENEECTRILILSPAGKQEVECASELRDLVMALEAEYPGLPLYITAQPIEERLTLTISVGGGVSQ